MDRMGGVGNQSSRAHIAVPDGFYFFEVVPAGDIVEDFEAGINFSNQVSRESFSEWCVKSLKSVNMTLTSSNCFASALPFVFSSSNFFWQNIEQE